MYVIKTLAIVLIVGLSVVVVLAGLGSATDDPVAFILCMLGGAGVVALVIAFLWHREKKLEISNKPRC